jgi:hypothetical protein
MALLTERDSRAWQALAAAISNRVEPRLAPGVLANRSLLESSERRYFASQLRNARRAAATLARESGAVVRTDVRAFYPSVTPSVAFRALVALNVEAPVASRAAEMLEGWGSEGYAGLPIGPPASAILANAVLAPVDTRLRELSFLRWVDDYVIGLTRAASVPEVLDRLDSALDCVGLKRSAPKTSLLEGPGSFSWLGTYEPVRVSNSP